MKRSLIAALVLASFLAPTRGHAADCARCYDFMVTPVSVEPVPPPTNSSTGGSTSPLVAALP